MAPYQGELKLDTEIPYLIVRREPEMFERFVNSVFGCSHKRTTFPMTPARRSAGSQVQSAARHGTYVVCLDCGKELAYDWLEMRVGKPVGARMPAPQAEPIFR
jgi:hypothetical protein